MGVRGKFQILSPKITAQKDVRLVGNFKGVKGCRIKRVMMSKGIIVRFYPTEINLQKN